MPIQYSAYSHSCYSTGLNNASFEWNCVGGIDGGSYDVNTWMDSDTCSSDNHMISLTEPTNMCTMLTPNDDDDQNTYMYGPFSNPVFYAYYDNTYSPNYNYYIPSYYYEHFVRMYVVLRA